MENIEVEKIKFTPDYEAGKRTFWHVFKELSKNNNGLVSYYNLQERLVSTGQFFVGEALLSYMEKTGEIEHTDQYHVYRQKKADSPN